MTDTNRLRKLLEKHGGAEAVWESDELFDAIMQELPALLDKADKYDKFAASVESYLAEQTND